MKKGITFFPKFRKLNVGTHSGWWWWQEGLLDAL